MRAAPIRSYVAMDKHTKPCAPARQNIILRGDDHLQHGKKYVKALPVYLIEYRPS